MSFLDRLTSAITPNSIDGLKSVVDKRNGLAKQNRFAIFMNPPSQTLLSLNRSDLEGFAASSLSGSFDVKSVISDPRDIAILCESCTLPSKTLTTIETPLGGYRQLVKYPSGYANTDITFTFHLTGDYYMRKIFDKWVNAAIDPETYTISYDSEFKVDVVIQQLNESNIPIYGLKLRGAFPTEIEAVELSNANADSTQRMTVTLSYEEATPEGALTTALSGVKNMFGRPLI